MPEELIIINMMKKGILITTDTEMDGKQAQDSSSSFGKILFIDFQTQKSEIFSRGHRTPQGLYVEDDLILAANTAQEVEMK